MLKNQNYNFKSPFTPLIYLVGGIFSGTTNYAKVANMADNEKQSAHLSQVLAIVFRLPLIANRNHKLLVVEKTNGKLL